MISHIPEPVQLEHARLVKPLECRHMEATMGGKCKLADACETARYLTPFAVTCEYQGYGLGSKMMRAFHDAVGDEPVALHAASSEQVSLLGPVGLGPEAMADPQIRLYRRHGYQSATRYESHMPDGSEFMLDLMVRQAQ